MTARVEYTITEAAYDAMAAVRQGRAFARERRSGQWQDIEITPAGLAAMRAHELARPPARGAAGRSPVPPRVQLAAASPERPAAAADFLER